MKTLIDTAPEAIQNNYKRRRYGNASMAAGYLEAAEYSWGCQYDVPAYVPVFGPMLKALEGDTVAFLAFKNAHAEELAAERLAAIRHAARNAWRQGPSAAEMIEKNQAAVAADQLEADISRRADVLMRERELAARAAAFADARLQAASELGGQR